MRNSSGSVLILALVTVLVASMLAVGAAAILRSALNDVASRRGRAADERAAIEFVERFAREVIAPDTNEFDCAGEAWRPQADEASREEEPLLVPEFPDVDEFPCIDEESRLSLNSAPASALSALTRSRAGRAKPVADAIAAEIVTLRPFPRREFAMRAKSLSHDDYAAIAPYVTATPSEAVNINTAPLPVLKALFAAAREYGSVSADTLARKIIDFRKAGGHLESTDAAALDAALGGLNQTEVQALMAASKYLAVKSRHFSATAHCGAASVVFTYDREEQSFVRLQLH